MPLRGTKIGRVLRQRRDDAAIAWTFFRQWLKAPLTTAAVSPSSKELAAEMLSQLPDGTRKVIELGGGTGRNLGAGMSGGTAYVYGLKPERVNRDSLASGELELLPLDSADVEILTDLLRDRKANLATAAEQYARMTVAMSDAFVATWKVKYQLNLIRPVTYIQLAFDSNWVPPLMETPPFPEYPSGHSVQSGSAPTRNVQR